MVSFPFFKKKEESPLYFGVTVTDVSTSGFVFDLQEGKPQIRTQSSYDVPPVYDQVLQALDTVISDIESAEKITIKNTIFFLLSSQLDGQTHEMKEPYKSILKKASAELALVPMGYIDMHDAIATSLKDKSVVNFILTEVDQHTVSIFVYKGSTSIFTASQTRTSSIAEDLEALILKRPAGTLLPPKLYLYGSTDMPHVSSELSTHVWSESVFTQHPVIEIVKEGTIMQILADTCASELMSQPAKPDDTLPSPALLPESEEKDTMGFMIGADVASLQSPPAADLPPVQVAPTAPLPSPFEHDAVTKAPARPPRAISTLFQFHMPQLSFSGQSGKWGMLAGGVFAVICILGGGFGAFEYSMHTAQIEVQVESKSLQQSFNLNLPIAESSSDATLSALLHTKTVAISQSLDTSGKRDIGEKAKGQVVIHNFDTAEKNFEKGTKITAGAYSFLLDTSVTVASSSGVTSDGVKQSGKAKVSVTAEGIGPEYNLKNSTQFSIASLQTALFVAFADGGFTGGTKKQITTVSKSDLETLKKKAQEAATAQTGKTTSSLLPVDEVMISGLSEVELTDLDFSKEIGEEASQVTLKAKAEQKFYSVKRAALLKTITDRLRPEVPSSFTLDPKRITYSFIKPSKQAKKNEVALSLKVDAQALKSVDEAELKKRSARRFTSQLLPALQSIEGVQNAVIIAQKPLVPFISWTPVFARNITIRIDSR